MGSFSLLDLVLVAVVAALAVGWWGDRCRLAAATNPSAPKLRWFQIRLVSLFIGVALIALSLLMVIVPAERQRGVVVRIERLGGGVQYAEPLPDESGLVTMLREWLPRDYFDTVDAVSFRGTQIRDDDLRDILKLHRLRQLDLTGTQITDEGMAQLQKLPHLKSVLLSGTLVTPPAITAFNKTTNCLVFY